MSASAVAAASALLDRLYQEKGRSRGDVLCDRCKKYVPVAKCQVEFDNDEEFPDCGGFQYCEPCWAHIQDWRSEPGCAEYGTPCRSCEEAPGFHACDGDECDNNYVCFCKDCATRTRAGVFCPDCSQSAECLESVEKLIDKNKPINLFLASWIDALNDYDREAAAWELVKRYVAEATPGERDSARFKRQLAEFPQLKDA